jgi:hypothetical protein
VTAASADTRSFLRGEKHIDLPLEVCRRYPFPGIQLGRGTLSNH